MLKISQKGPFWKYSLKRSFLVRTEEVARNTYTAEEAVPLLVADQAETVQNLVYCHQNVEEVMVESVMIMDQNVPG